ncbi:MAG: cytochrome C oxidase subunit IV family protein [Chloroflexi bacterium]|nr:cytochrome C oxidase subunit IV family protein [Chloroflexota bacterium]
MQNGRLRSALARGRWVLVALVALTVVEYAVALVMKSGNLPWMIIMNLVDAVLILYYFMHIAQLWRKEE